MIHCGSKEDNKLRKTKKELREVRKDFREFQLVSEELERDLESELKDLMEENSDLRKKLKSKEDEVEKLQGSESASLFFYNNSTSTCPIDGEFKLLISCAHDTLKRLDRIYRKLYD